MKQTNVKTIAFDGDLYARVAEKYYRDGNYVAALKYSHKQLEQAEDNWLKAEAYTRLCDLYEDMGLHAQAIAYLFEYLDICDEEELPDVYESLAVNFLNLGNESQSAYYYNKLIDVDDTLPEETRQDIIDAFSQRKNVGYRFVYPPQKADYSKEMETGGKALKNGAFEKAISLFSSVEKGAKDYPEAMELQAVAYLLADQAKEAERVCEELLKDYPDRVQAMATLAAVYLEQGRAEDSKKLALALCELPLQKTDEIFKVATVCCENGLHREAYENFVKAEKQMPYDGRLLYFKGVSAYKSGLKKQAKAAFEELVDIYPDAEVVRYYLKKIKEEEQGGEQTEISYFYRVPEKEREMRCRALIDLGKYPKTEAEIVGIFLQQKGYFSWCFDEMDGAEKELQYLALVVAAHARADGFLRRAMLNPDTADALKVETLRVLYERNEEMNLGVVIYNIYKKVKLERICIGRKKRKFFIDAYARLASKFVIINDEYGRRIKRVAERLYRAIEKYEQFDLIDDVDDCACAMYLLSGLKELGTDIATVCKLFEANQAKVQVLLSTYLYAKEEE